MTNGPTEYEYDETEVAPPRDTVRDRTPVAGPVLPPSRPRPRPQDHQPPQRSAMDLATTFYWTAPNGQEIGIPRLDTMNSGLVREHRRRDSLDFLYTMLEETAHPAVLKQMDELTLADVNNLFGEWMKQTGAKLGE